MSKNIQHSDRLTTKTIFSSRMVFEKKGSGDSEPYEEVVEIGSEKKEGGKKDKGALKAEYEKARNDVREKLKKFEDKKGQYKVFLDYAEQRLNQVDRDLQHFDVLDEKHIRDNLKRLQNILIFTLDDSLKDRRKEIVAMIERQKKAAVKKLEDRAKQHAQMLADEVKPETLKFAQTKFNEVKAQTNFLFNSRIQAVDTSMYRAQDPKWGDMATRTETLMIYFQSVEDGLNSNEEGSTNAEAEKLFKDYESAVRGQYCLEETKQGVAVHKIQTICLEYKVNYVDKRKDVYDAFDKLGAKYKVLMEGVKGADAYKIQGVIYGQFLDEVREIYRTLLAGDKDVPVRNFGLSAMDQVNAGRKANEKKWDKVDRNDVRLVAYRPTTEFVMKSGQDIHYLAEGDAPEGMNGVAIDHVRGGETVFLVDQNPVKVGGKEYLHVEVRDKKGNVTSDGWVRSDAMNPFDDTKKKADKKKKGDIA
ncbi:hypothetical protein IT413_04315 [Candidatus Peregrinibacteria bacterium]|nr:hypothetical protein [Candidatus Peregrinibacteria bacterium]